MSQNDPTAHERGERYRAKQEEREMVRVHPWVPANRKQDLLDFAAKLRKEEADDGELPAE